MKCCGTLTVVPGVARRWHRGGHSVQPSNEPSPMRSRCACETNSAMARFHACGRLPSLRRDASRASAAARDAAGDHRDCAILFRLGEKPISLENAAERDDASFRLLQTTPSDELTTPAGPVRVIRRHSCEFHGRRFAHVIMQFHGQVVSLLMTSDGGQTVESVNGEGSPPHLE